MFCKIGYFCLTLPITRSTWIQTFAIVLVPSLSRADSWFLLLVKAGMLSHATESAMSKPLSAKITSPGREYHSVSLSTQTNRNILTKQLVYNIRATAFWASTSNYWGVLHVWSKGKYIEQCFIRKLKNFAWEDQRAKVYIICHKAHL